jgi:hypothetical protein
MIFLTIYSQVKRMKPKDFWEKVINQELDEKYGG